MYIVYVFCLWEHRFSPVSLRASRSYVFVNLCEQRIHVFLKHSPNEKWFEQNFRKFYRDFSRFSDKNLVKIVHLDFKNPKTNHKTNFSNLIDVPKMLHVVVVIVVENAVLVLLFQMLFGRLERLRLRLKRKTNEFIKFSSRKKKNFSWDEKHNFLSNYLRCGRRWDEFESFSLATTNERLLLAHFERQELCETVEISREFWEDTKKLSGEREDCDWSETSLCSTANASATLLISYFLPSLFAILQRFFSVSTFNFICSLLCRCALSGFEQPSQIHIQVNSPLPPTHSNEICPLDRRKHSPNFEINPIHYS